MGLMRFAAQRASSIVRSPDARPAIARSALRRARAWRVPLPSPRHLRPHRSAVLALAVGLLVVVPGPVAAVQVPGSPSHIAYDVSWPNCSAVDPAGTVLSVVGVTGGKAFTSNPCLRSEYLGARRKGDVRFYINLNSPKGTIGMRGPAGRCSITNLACQAYNYGYRAAEAAWAYAASQIGTAPLATRWWLDIELTNTWSSRAAVNARVIAGALTFLGRAGHASRVGIYSTGYQWRVIAGTYRPRVAVWYATVARGAATAARSCSQAHAFTGGSVRMVQYQPGGVDRDYLCP